MILQISLINEVEGENMKFSTKTAAGEQAYRFARTTEMRAAAEKRIASYLKALNLHPAMREHLIEEALRRAVQGAASANAPELPGLAMRELYALLGADRSLPSAAAVRSTADRRADMWFFESDAAAVARKRDRKLFGTRRLMHRTAMTPEVKRSRPHGAIRRLIRLYAG